jgi:hypothetical protein
MYILAVLFAVFLLVKYPLVLIITGSILAILFVADRKYIPKETEPDSSEEGKPYIPYENDVDTLFKPGYKDDPKWQELSTKINTKMDENRATEDKKRAESELRERYNKALDQ